MKRALSSFLCALLIFTQLLSGIFTIKKSYAMPAKNSIVNVNESKSEEAAYNSDTEGSKDAAPDINETDGGKSEEAVAVANVDTDQINWYLENKGADRYQIGRAKELQGLAELVNGAARDAEDKPIEAVNFAGDTITLKNDLTLDGQEWVPIGNAKKSFKGTFDGNGYIIEGLKIEKTVDYAGLFGNITGTVKNLGVIGNIKSAGDKKGGIAGNAGGAIENCFYYDFGFTALAGGNNASIKNSYYLAEANRKGDATAKTIEQFKSGEVAYLLGKFGQTLGVNDYPVSNGKKVHKITFSTEVENLIIEPSLMYVNTTLSKMPNLTGKAATDLPEGLDYVPLTDSELITNQTPISSDLELRIVKGFYPNSNGIFELSSKEKLKAFSWLVKEGLSKASAVIKEDIKLQDIKTSNGEVITEDLEAWDPIGTKEMPYEGNFDGRGFTISGLWMDGDEEYSGLFGYVKGGTISNIAIDGYINSTGQYTGGIVAYAESAQIKKCENNVLIKGGSYAGGIAGAIDKKSKLQYSYGLKPVTTSGRKDDTGHGNGGLIIGENSGQGNSCFYYNPEDRGNSSLVGAGTPLKNSYYLAADDYSGEDPSAKTTAQFISGEVAHLLDNSNSEFGQYLGYEDRPYFLEKSIQVYKVIFNYLGKNGEVKDILGGYCTYVNQNMPIELPELPPLEEGKEYLFIKDEGEFVTPSTRVNKDTAINVLEGMSPGESGLIEIKTAGDLVVFQDMINAGMSSINAVLENDISLEGIKWVPIGNDPFGKIKYKGNFNGNGHTISGLSIGTAEKPAGYNQGLFGNCENAVINDLTVIGEIYTNGEKVGGIVGTGTNITLRNCTFGSEDVPGYISANGRAGGLIGELTGYESLLEGKLVNYADITARSAEQTGGLAGVIKGIIDGAELYNYGKILGKAKVGGLFGTTFGGFNSMTKTCVFINEGDVSGEEDVGGITGEQLASTALAYKTLVENRGAITGKNNVGGIYGSTFTIGYSNVDAMDGTIRNRGRVKGVENAGGLIGYVPVSSGSVFDTNIDPSALMENDIKGLNEGEAGVSGVRNVGGLFGYVGKGISDAKLQLVNKSSVSCVDNGGESEGIGAGGIVGKIAGIFTASEGVIKNIGQISGKDAVGGIIGLAEGTITLGKGAVHSEGKITAQKNAGGLFGEISNDLNAAAEANYNVSGDVSAEETAGGIVGRAAPATGTPAIKIAGAGVTGENITGKITGNIAAGTVAGSAAGVEFIACYSNLAPQDAPAKGMFLGQAKEGSTVSVKGSYYIDENGASSGFVGKNDGNEPELKEAYFLVPDDYEGSATGAAKRAEFASGEIAFEMAHAVKDSAVEATWGQKMGTDAFPQLADDEHPAIYKIGIEKNEELPDTTVEFAETPESGVWFSRGLYAYANPGTLINLKATGVPAGKELAFLPLDAVSLNTAGVYQIICEKDITISYDLEETPEIDWYNPEQAEFTLTTEGQLRGLTKLVNSGIDFSGKIIILGADITLKVKRWTAIGTEEHPFKGTFEAAAKTGEEGEYYEVNGLNIETTKEKKGFFGYLSAAVISNLAIGGSIQGGNYIGSIAGFAENTRFENCVNAAILKGGIAGGLAGYAKGSAFINCENKIKEFETTGDTGGLAGLAENCTFRQCNNNIEFTSSTGTFVGGIAGQARGSSLTECFNTGVINGVTNVGGLAGFAAEGTEFNNCGNKGTVSGQNKIGGTAGTADGGLFDNCINEGTVDGKSEIGGIVGYVETGEITLKHCSNAKEAGIVSAGGDYSGGVVGYLIGSARLEDCSNSGTVTGKYDTAGVAGKIGVQEDEGAIIWLIDCYNNGMVTGQGDYTAGVVAEAYDLARKGCYNVKGCYNGEDGVVTGKNYTGGVGGMMGYDCVITDCNNSGKVEGKDNTGGVMGLCQDGEISSCFNSDTGEVSGGNNTGGVFGKLNAFDNLSNVYNNGSVTGNGQYTGGVMGAVGRGRAATTYVYNKGIVRGSGQYTGGVFGRVEGGNKDYISFCYNKGEVEGSGNYVGGIAGYLSGGWSWGSGYSISHLTNCWNIGTVTGTGSATAAAGITGRQNDPLYAYTISCFNYGIVNGVSASKTGAITAEGDMYNQNGLYLEGSVKVDDKSIRPVDLSYENLSEKPDMAFRNGEAAYLLDNGGSAERTMLWGQGSSYPVPADKEHQPIFKFQIELPDEHNQGAITYGTGKDAALEGYVAQDSEVQLAIKPDEGYMLDYVEVIGRDNTRQKAVLSEDAAALTVAMPASDITVTGAFTEQLTEEELKIEFTVTFDANGGKWSDGEKTKEFVIKNGSRLKPYEPVPEHEDDYGDSMEFTGWYIDEGCTEEYNFTALVKGSMTLYAGWYSESKHIVTFDANGGSFANGDTLQVVVVDGEKVKEITSGLTNGDKVFLGWFKDKQCAASYDFSKPVTENIVLYAGWRNIGEAVVYFDAGEGVLISGSGEKTHILRVVVQKGNGLTVPEQDGYTVKRDSDPSTSYQFDGWLTKGGDPWRAEAIVEEDMTLTAKWKKADLLALGTAEEPVKIDSLRILEDLRDRVNAGNTYQGCYFLLTADLKLPADWVSIAKSSIAMAPDHPFQGYFDGGGHTITLHNDQVYPIFGGVGHSGVITNCKIEGDRLTKLISAPFIGYLEGKVKNITLKAKLYNCSAGLIYTIVPGAEIENVTVKSGSVISGGELAGGIVGMGRTGHGGLMGAKIILMTDCVVEPGVRIEAKGPSEDDGTAKGVAGIMAYGGGTFTRCFNGADIIANNPSGSAYVAGILASGNSTYSAESVFYNCVNTGDFTITGGVCGGIAGDPYFGSGTSYSLNYCYSTGDITSTGTTGKIGGLVVSSSKIVNSYYYGTITVPEGTPNVGGVSASSSVPGGIFMSYYGLKPDANGNVADIPNPFEGKGLTRLPASSFESGEAAYLLDGGARRRELRWTQDEANKYPVHGEPPYYRFQASTDGNGTLILSTEEKEGTDIYTGKDSKVTITAVPKPSWIEGNMRYSYKLDTLEVNGADFGNKGIFDFQGDSIAKATFKLIAEEIKMEPPHDPDPPNDSDGKGKGDGDGTGTGDGPGEGGGEGIGAGEQQGTQKGEGRSDKVVDKSEYKIAIDNKPHEDRTEIKEELPHEETEEQEKESSTTFKTIQDRIMENPAVVIAVVLAILLINVVIAFIRFRKLKR